MIDVRVRNIPGLLETVDGEVVKFELQTRKVPDEILEFDLSSGDGFEFADHAPPHAITEPIAVQVETQTDDSYKQHQANAELYPA